MSNYPNKIDTDIDLPPVNDNITEIGAEAINALREAVFNIEEALGLNLPGSTPSLADRLNVSIQPDGYLYPSAFILPLIVDGYVAPNAGIKEYKLDLDHSTQDLYNDIISLTSSVNANTGWISAVGSKLNPHIAGTAYRHELSHILVSYDPLKYFKNRYDPEFPSLPNQGNYRDNADAYTLLNDINNDYLIHQKSDGYVYATIQNVNTLGGSTYPSNFAHTAGGIYLNSNGYNVIPSYVDNLKKLADFIDTSSALLIGSRLQNLFTSGISRVSRSVLLNLDGYGPPVVPPTLVQTFTEGDQLPPIPYVNDSVTNGDDIIIFLPDTTVTDTYFFDSQFAQVKVGDVVRVNYGPVQTQFLVKEKRYIPSANNNPSQFVIRVDGKNLLSTSSGYARIDRPTINYAKYGVLATSAAQIIINNQKVPTGDNPSLIITHPRGAVALGNEFDAASFNNTNYNLYLVIYPTGEPASGIQLLPIDVTGNKGSTPGKYTLDSIIEATNNAFRAIGYNYRFNAFSYQGQFGIALSDSYNNAAFSVIAGNLDSNGFYEKDPASYPNNIIRYDGQGKIVSDPLGFGATKSNIASPKYTTDYPVVEAAYSHPTKIFLPLKRNNFYVDGAGVESDKVNPLEPYQLEDENKDGYWLATVVSRSPQYSPDRYEITYEVPYLLSTSSLAVGKTLVVQPINNPFDSIVNYGRYVISNIQFLVDTCNNISYNKTLITLYDCMQKDAANSGTPIPDGTANTNDGYQYALYFNQDSVSFNLNNAFDSSYSDIPYKRHFEIYVSSKGATLALNQDISGWQETISLERGRMNVSGSNILIDGVDLYSDSNSSKIDIVRISPKLRGYLKNTVRSITLHIVNYDAATGNFYGHLMGGTISAPISMGPTIYGKVGEVTRFYDETGIDYIDFIYEVNNAPTISFTDSYISIQLFPSLALNDELLLLSSCQLNSSTKIINQVKDLRQFGNVSEKDLSTSALNYINANDRLIQQNGILRGFEVEVDNLDNCTLKINNGGVALVNGKLVQLNNQDITLPPLMENYNNLPYNMLWALCANEKGDYELIALLDGVSGGPSVDRKVKVNNVQSNPPISPYGISSLFFADLILDRKDLTPLYTIEVKCEYDNTKPDNKVPYVTYYAPTLKDVRKFISNEGVNNTLVWSETYNVDDSNTRDSVAYFHSFEEVTNWINYYGKFSNTIKIRGNVTVPSGLSFANINYPVTFEGDGSEANISMAEDFDTGTSYFTFKNLKINFTDANHTLEANSNNLFENVTFVLDNNRLSIVCGTNNKFINCFMPKMKTIEANARNEFNNCTFNNIENETYAIKLSFNNKFINCQFISDQNGVCISSTGGGATSQAISCISGNVFDSCLFSGAIESGYFGIYLNSFNKISNCNFNGDISATYFAFYLLASNTIENNNSLFDIISNQGIAMTLGGGNIVKNFVFRNMFSSSYGILITSIGNTIDGILCNGIVSPTSAIRIISSNNSIKNCVIYFLVCQNGIHIAGDAQIVAVINNIVISNNIINYKFDSTNKTFDTADYVKAGNTGEDGYGCIYIDNNYCNINTILIEKNELFQLGAFIGTNPCVPSGATIPVLGSYQCPPLVSVKIRGSQYYANDIVIEKCIFAGDASYANLRYAGIAFINPEDSDCKASNIIVKDNVSTIVDPTGSPTVSELIGNNGIILSGRVSNSPKLFLDNFNIINNKFSYISYFFSSDYIASGGLLIQGNTALAVTSWDATGNFIDGSSLNSNAVIGNVIIDNNYLELIDVITSS